MIENSVRLTVDLAGLTYIWLDINLAFVLLIWAQQVIMRMLGFFFIKALRRASMVDNCSRYVYSVYMTTYEFSERQYALRKAYPHSNSL